MKILLQRVKHAEVRVKENVVGKINQGLLLFFCAEKGDTKENSLWLAKKCSKLKLFQDENNKTTMNINQIKGELLIISQFTLAASCKKGNKANYSHAAPPEQAKELYNHFINTCQSLCEKKIQTGIFGSYMQVSLINDGPKTLLLSKTTIPKNNRINCV
ncbi:MAG: D-aminoacyl-tRNA deacylase [bacterium]